MVVFDLSRARCRTRRRADSDRRVRPDRESSPRVGDRSPGRARARRGARARTRESSPASRSALPHPIRRLAPDEALVDQRGEGIQVDLADRLRRFERPTTGEHAQAREAAPLGFIEQLIAPADRLAQRLVPRGNVACTPREHTQAVVEPLKDPTDREHVDPGRRELEREREPVKPFADRGHLAVRVEIGPNRLRSLGEQADRVPFRKSGHRVLALGGDVQRLSARDEHSQVRTGGDEFGDVDGGVDNLLEVVERDQHAGVADRCGRLGRRSECLRDRRADEPRVAERVQRHPADAAREIRRRQPPPRPGPDVSCRPRRGRGR